MKWEGRCLNKWTASAIQVCLPNTLSETSLKNMWKLPLLREQGWKPCYLTACGRRCSIVFDLKADKIISLLIWSSLQRENSILSLAITEARAGLKCRWNSSPDSDPCVGEVPAERCIELRRAMSVSNDMPCITRPLAQGGKLLCSVIDRIKCVLTFKSF